MSKITFRADDDLVAQLEEFDASKSEIMREALRQYLDEPSANPGVNAGQTASDDDTVVTADDRLDELIRERIDELVAERMTPAFTPASGQYTRPEPQTLDVNITVDGVTQASDADDTEASVQQRKTRPTDDTETVDGGVTQCPQCGENVGEDHVYCPNCGEKSTHRVFCECGDELRSDWGFCPSCGRRTPAADVLDRS